MSRVIDKLFGGSPELLLAQLIETENLPRGELLRLRRLVEKRLRERR